MLSVILYYRMIHMQQNLMCIKTAKNSYNIFFLR